MKSEIYNALAALNRGIDVVLESLTILQQQETITPEYMQQQTEIAEEVRAGLNHTIMDKLQSREAEEWHHFGKLRLETESRLKSS